MPLLFYSNLALFISANAVANGMFSNEKMIKPVLSNMPGALNCCSWTDRARFLRRVFSSGVNPFSLIDRVILPKIHAINANITKAEAIVIRKLPLEEALPTMPERTQAINAIITPMTVTTLAPRRLTPTLLHSEHTGNFNFNVVLLFPDQLD